MPARPLAAACAALLLAACMAQARPAPLSGVWIAQSGNVAVRFVPCGAALCGDVVRVMGNASMQGSGQQIAEPPRIGLRIFSDLRPDGDAWKGRLFNRENGRTYDCRVRQVGDRLEVRGYVGIPLFGQSQVWAADG